MLGELLRRVKRFLHLKLGQQSQEVDFGIMNAAIPEHP